MFVALLAAVAVTAPVGFAENATLDARAAKIAGHPVSVYCASTDAAWGTYVASLPTSPPDGIANGYTPTIPGNTTYLSPATCRPIVKRLARLTPSWLLFGATLDILAHEGFHMSGVTDEGQTECDAYRALPAFLVSSWGIRKNSKTFQLVMRGASNYHRALPPQYRTVC